MKTVDELLKALKKDGFTIGDQAQIGNLKAISVMNCYQLLRTSPGDTAALALTISAYEEWKVSQK